MLLRTLTRMAHTCLQTNPLKRALWGRLDSGRVAWGTPGPYVLRALVGQHPVSNNHAEVLCFANTKVAEDVRLAKGDVPVRATVTTLATLKASQLRPEGSAEGPGAPSPPPFATLLQGEKQIGSDELVLKYSLLD
jgi:hypothetical protein